MERNVLTISWSRSRAARTLRRCLCLVILALSLVIGSTLVAPQHHARASTLPPGFVESLVAGTFRNPTSVNFAPDGRIFVTEKGGNVKVIKNGTLLSTPFVQVPAVTTEDLGLMGLAFDPNFA